jgi:hypothetical protein
MIPVMPTVAFAAPYVPGGLDIDRAAMASIQNERKDAHHASRQRAGITREEVWIQPTPMGDLAIVVLEADDLEKAFATIATSNDPFDQWFRGTVQQAHGIDLEGGMDLPEHVLGYNTNA